MLEDMTLFPTSCYDIRIFRGRRASFEASREPCDFVRDDRNPRLLAEIFVGKSSGDIATSPRNSEEQCCRSIPFYKVERIRCVFGLSWYATRTSQPWVSTAYLNTSRNDFRAALLHLPICSGSPHDCQARCHIEHHLDWHYKERERERGIIDILPYFLPHCIYTSDASSIGKSNIFPMNGFGLGPGG